MRRGTWRLGSSRRWKGHPREALHGVPPAEVAGCDRVFRGIALGPDPLVPGASVPLQRLVSGRGGEVAHA